MKPTTYEERIAALSEILPAEVIELIKGHFLAVLNSYQINEVYNRAYPEEAKEGLMHTYLKGDKADEHLYKVEDHLWKRACTGLNDWLYEAFVESLKPSEIQ